MASLARTLPLLALLALASAARANDLYVGPSGSGAPFHEISHALAAAAAGDTIHVAPGRYSTFNIDQPVRVIGAGSALVTVLVTEGLWGVRIEGIPLGAEAVLSGVTVRETATGKMVDNGNLVRVFQCAGAVVLHDVHALPLEGGSQTGPAVGTELCDEVLVIDCQFRGFNGCVGPMAATSAMTASTSKVWITDSTLIGGDDCLPHSTAEHTGVPGLRVDSAFVHVTDSIIRAGYTSSDGAVIDFYARAGIQLDFSRLVLAGGPGNLTRGGDALPAGGVLGHAGPGISLNVGSIVLAADAAVEGGLDPLGQPAPPVEGTLGFVDTLAYALPALAANAEQVAPGGAFGLALSGNPHSPALVFYAVASGPMLQFADLDGFGLLDAATAKPLAALALDAGGTAALSVSVPPLPSLAGRLALFQSLELGPATSAISGPALVTVAP